MNTAQTATITVQALVNAPLPKVWEAWNAPGHITKWYQASPDWHAPYAENDLRENGKLKITLAAKDGSVSFDFEGVYTNVSQQKAVEYVLGDGRKVKVTFASEGPGTRVTETFDPENTNSLELQRSGWQAILDSFKKYAERL